MKILWLEPFYGGSHRAVVHGWANVSRHEVAVESMPARFWKWRMRGAAFEFARRAWEYESQPDLLFASSTMDVAHFKALAACGKDAPPIALYFHENQAAYPLREGEGGQERDLQYAFTDLASAAAADAVAFNSAFQRETFFDGMRRILKRMPDARPGWLLEKIREKTSVLELGVETEDVYATDRVEGDGGAPVVLWNHRWEYDKDPETFFGVLFRLADKGVDFRLIVAGENYERAPAIFAQARQRLADRVLHWGYAESRQAYVELMARADLVISTAWQENFGISMVEAALAGAHPLAPNRLSYPEVFDDSLHEQTIYADETDLEQRLEQLLVNPATRIPPDVLRERFGRYSWNLRATAFDAFAERVSGKGEM